MVHKEITKTIGLLSPLDRSRSLCVLRTRRRRSLDSSATALSSPSQRRSWPRCWGRTSCATTHVASSTTWRSSRQTTGLLWKMLDKGNYNFHTCWCWFWYDYNMCVCVLFQFILCWSLFCIFVPSFPKEYISCHYCFSWLIKICWLIYIDRVYVSM